VLASSSRAFRNCIKKEGRFRRNVIFDVTREGTFTVIESTSICFKKVIERLKAGKYQCKFPFLYEWDGKFPLINQYQNQIEFK